jgi:hypothetical protein
MSKNITVWSPTTGDLVLTAALLSEILGEEGGAIIDTAITTVGAGTLTAAALVGGQIGRTGPTSAYTDTTDTAAAIVTALGGFVAGQTFVTTIKNATAFTQTLAGGTGVSFLGSLINPAMGSNRFFGTVGGTAASPTVVFTHTTTTAIYAPPTITDPQALALTTVGAGTITAAGIIGGITTRGGVQIAAFTDTTDTAANIIAAASNLSIVGGAFVYRYVNNTIFPATVHAGATVTLTDTVVPANSWADFLVTATSATAVSMVLIGQGYFPVSGTVTANAATPVVVSNAAVTANSQILLTYKSGTQGATGAFVSASVPGTSFSIKSVASDTAVYNYTILG